MKRWTRVHGLVLVNAALFLLFFVGMAASGWQVSNSDLVQHGMPVESLGAYLGSGDFVEALSENWESEFLQMGSYVVLTVFLFQKGSPESKPLGGDPQLDADPRQHADDPRAPWPVRRGGWLLRLYENSLLILFAILFFGAFAAHVVGGAAAYSQQQSLHGEPPVTPWQYLGTSQMWFQSFQNWQSEFMVVAVLAVASVYLRQRGSTQSKPVAAPHTETGD